MANRVLGLASTLVSLAIVLAVWWFGWRKPIAGADTGEEPSGSTAFLISHIAAAFVLGFLIPRHAKWAGPVLLAAALLWIVVHVASYDGSQGVSFWPIALVLIAGGMGWLSVMAFAGRWLRIRITPEAGQR